MKALLLAAGLGTRLRPLTDHTTKCLLPIAGRPLLGYWVDELIVAGIRQALINTHHLAEQVRTYIQQVNQQGQIQLDEAYEPQLLGSAGTIAANPDFADDVEHVVIIYADNFSTLKLKELIDFHSHHPDPITMLLFHAPNPRACGIAELNEQQQIMSFEEKPSEPKSDFANAGVYVVDAPIYRQIAQMKAFDLGFDVLPKFIGKMRGWIWEGYHRDMGTYPTYLQAQRDAVELFPSKNCRPAVFLDRDGTVIEQVHYLSKPEQVKLLPDSGEAIKQLRKAGFACILVTNQAAVGHGLLTEENLREIHQVLIDQLAQQGAELDGFYYCTKTSSLKDRTVVEYYDRKPGPGMLFKAAMELQLDLKRSWMIGDMASDLLAGYHAHCKGLIRVISGKELEYNERISLPISWHEVANLLEASQFVQHH